MQKSSAIWLCAMQCVLVHMNLLKKLCSSTDLSFLSSIRKRSNRQCIQDCTPLPTERDQLFSAIVSTSSGGQITPSGCSSAGRRVCPYPHTGGQIISLNSPLNLLHTKFDPKNKNQNKTKINKKTKIQKIKSK